MMAATRRMLPEDLGAVLAIAGASPEAPRWREAEFRAYLEPGPPGPLLRMALVAEAEGRVAGFAAATLLLDGTENRCELDTMAVDPGARRRGVGTALLERVLAWAAENGARRMGLEVRASNAAALMLYRRKGFAEEGRRRGYYLNPREDALVLGTSVTEVLRKG
jgi:[ribosomal protein S18]-alanine N-acetyltransferase